MSIHIDDRGFANAQPLPVLVLVGLGRKKGDRRFGLNRADVAGILIHCRAALRHARATGMAVAFVRDKNAAGREPDWLGGFEPTRDDMIFERWSPSCYSSRYFGEMAQARGLLVIAGFLGSGGGLSTAADAEKNGNRIIFLRDAVLDEASGRFPPSLASLEAFARLDVHLVETRQWIEATALASNQKMYPGRGGPSRRLSENMRIPSRGRIGGIR